MGVARLVVVGGGKMGEALVAGLLRAGWAEAAQLVVAEPVASRRDELAARFSGVRVVDVPDPAEGALVAVQPRDVRAARVGQTLLGAARLLTESGQGPEALRAAVTTPGGTTAAGLRALEAAGLRSAFLEAVAAATARSQELGRAQG